jgi:hypothetical protein
MAELTAFLREMNFLRTYDVSPDVPLAKIFRHKKRCGIYVLHFANGEVYAGQAVNVVRRYSQHCKKYSDIVRVSFKSVALLKLNDEEKRVIWELEKGGYHIRNIVHASATYAPSPFDEIMLPEDQDRWVNNINYLDLRGERIDDLVLRRKYSLNYARLLEKPYVEEIITVTREYVRIGIPAPIRSELFYWSCSCLPSGDKKIYLRININWQEVFAAYFDNNNPLFVFNVAKSPIELRFGKYRMFRFDKFLKHPTLYRFKQGYAPGGQDQVRIEIRGTIQDALKALQDIHIANAIRTFNLRLMRKGPNASYRFHCLDLADRLLEFRRTEENTNDL